MVNTLQIIVYFNSVKINLSAEAIVFLDKLRIIALGEFIPYDWLKNYCIDQWNLSIESIDELGSMALFIGALFALTLIVLFLGKIIKQLGYSQKLINLIKQRLFWNTFIRSSLQAYIKVLFVYMTMILALEFHSFAASFKSVFIILVVLALIGLPILYTIILWKNRKRLDNENIKSKIGSLYLGNRVEKIQQYLCSIVFLVRRLAYILMVISLMGLSVLFSVGLVQLNMLYLYYIVIVRPNDSRNSLKMEMMNEIILQIISYHILFTGCRNFYKTKIDGFLEAVENEKTLLFDQRLGQSMIICIVALQIFNLIVILGTTI